MSATGGSHTGRNLSKSKLLAFRQCPRRLWLSLHRPELGDFSPSAQARLAAGHEVGELARRLYDPSGKGRLLDAQADGYAEALSLTAELLGSHQPIFEAGFSGAGVLAFADVMIPVRRRGGPGWRMVEVKSSASVKDYHRDDLAIQTHVARACGVKLESVSIAHIDSGWVYPGGGDYRGLLTEVDLTEETFGRDGEVRDWVAEAQAVARRTRKPAARTGAQCSSPFECEFIGHCSSQEPPVEFPVTWIPRVQGKALKAFLAQDEITDMRQVPDGLLSPVQLRVKQQTLSGSLWFDASAARRAVRAHSTPLLFLDFESIAFVVPRWPGTRPYAQIPFQFSLHRMTADGELEHEGFLDLSGDNPARGFTKALIKACGTDGPVFVYNASFEKQRMKELGEQFPRQSAALDAIRDRVVDLHPITQACLYHPSQQGSWSLKKVLPVVAPDLSHAQLDGVQDGTGAMDAYIEAIDAQTSADRKAEIERQLLEYCSLDTLALIRLWQVLAGKVKLKV